MFQHPLLISVCLAAVALLNSSPDAVAQLPWEEHGHLRVSDDGRYLVHEDGTPFTWIGDTGWALFYKLGPDEVSEYLDARQDQGFNVIQAVAYWYPHGEDGPGPTNAANVLGHRPFEGGPDSPHTGRPRTVDGGTAEQPNDYWDHADFVLREINKRGMYLALLPCWGRAYINPQMDGPARVLFSPEQARSYGRFLGQRYGDEPHLVWVLGGDANATAGVDEDQFDVYRAMAEGIGEGATGERVRWNEPNRNWDRLLMTYHPDGAPAYNSSNWFHHDAWLDFNGIETWKSIDKVYDSVARDYQLDDPVKPTMLLEGAYEQGKYPQPGARITAAKARQQAYHTFFAGGAGHTYGGYPIWDFTRDPSNDAYSNTWRQALRFPGAPQIGGVLRQLMEEIEWWRLSPYPAAIISNAGSGRGRIVALRSNDQKRLVVYFPEARPAEIEMGRQNDVVATATWFDPRDGKRVDAGTTASKSKVEFRPPETWEDAVLVITFE